MLTTYLGISKTQYQLNNKNTISSYLDQTYQNIKFTFDFSLICRNKKEMDNFISVLSTTLRLNNDKPSPNGDEEEDDDVDDVAVEEDPQQPQATPPRLFNGATYYVKSPSQMKTPHVVIGMYLVSGMCWVPGIFGMKQCVNVDLT